MVMPKMQAGAPPMPKPAGGGQPMAGGAPMPGGEEANASPDQVRSAIMTVLQRVKTIADRYGLDLQEMVAEMGAGRPAGRATPPPPTGGGMGGGQVPPPMA